MGQFLAIGLRISATVSKKDVEKRLDKEKSVDDTLGLIEKRYGLTDIYERKEKDEYYIYSLKKDVLDKEYVPFIEKFYSLRYQGGDHLDNVAAVDELKKLPDTSARLALLEKKSFQTYQEGDDIDYFYPVQWRSSEIRIYSHNAILSLDGKIIMECYGSLFDFFRRSIMAQMPEFELAKALTVWIDG